MEIRCLVYQTRVRQDEEKRRLVKKSSMKMCMNLKSNQEIVIHAAVPNFCSASKVAMTSANNQEIEQLRNIVFLIK